MEEVKIVKGFPSDFLSPETKASKEYSLKWAKSLEEVGLNSPSNGFFPGFLPDTQLNKFAYWRSYSRGNQPISKYKPSLRINDKKVRNDPQALSYRVLNWEILDIYSKYVNVLIGKLIEQNNDVGVMAIDKRAQDERRATEIGLQESVINGSFLNEVSGKTGIQFESPAQQDVVPLPETLGEIPVHMEMFYKEEYCLIVQDILKSINEDNNYNEILNDVARNLVEIATAATKVYRVGEKIMQRSCDPARMGVGSSTKSDYSNVKYIWEDWDLTIGQLKEIAGDQLTEGQYRDIAEKISHKSFNEVNISDFFQNNLCYPWDNTKITAKDCVWFSPDWKTEVVRTDGNGNVETKKKPYGWWEDLKKEIPDLTVESYNKHNQADGRSVARYRLDNQYQCLWIKGTDYVVNYGLSRDMLKNMSSIGKTIGPYTLHQLKKCITESVVPTLDMAQIQWMQFQHHSAKSVPAGPAIEFTALQDISLEGAGGKLLTPRQALNLYWDTGVLLWRRRDAAGNMSNFKPIQEMAGGISDAMEKHFSNLIQLINLLKGQIGLNDMTDASTPNSEMGKAVASMASGGTDDALRPLHFAFDQLNLGTQRRTVMHVSGMARTGLVPYAEAVGMKSIGKLKLLSDLTEHELGVYLMKQPTQEINMWINEYCKVGIQQGTLFPEEALEIQNEPNVHRRIKLLKMYRAQKQKQAMADEEQKAQIKSQNDTATAQAASQAAQEASQSELDGKIEYEWEKARATVWAKKQTIPDEAFLLNIQAKNSRNEALTLAEQDRLTKMMEIDRTGEWNLRIAKAKPKPKPSAK